jgi:hypothetical protein
MKRTNKPEKSQFHTAAGLLTAYAFACGYVEKYETGEDRLTLCREPNDWHVKGFIDGVHVWESFEPLKEARQFCKNPQVPA